MPVTEDIQAKLHAGQAATANTLRTLAGQIEALPLSNAAEVLSWIAPHLERLRSEVVRLTDWRTQLRAHQSQLVVACVATGFVLGGGIAGIRGLRARREGRASSGPGGLNAVVVRVRRLGRS